MIARSIDISPKQNPNGLLPEAPSLQSTEPLRECTKSSLDRFGGRSRAQWNPCRLIGLLGQVPGSLDEGQRVP